MSDETNRADSPDRLTALWRRAKEHRIGQWTIGYVAVAYGIQHAITLTAEAFEWPNAVIRLSMLLLGLGLPIAITLAWYHGERASSGFSRAEFSILTTLLLGVSILFYTFVQPATRTPTAAPAIQEAGVTAARQASLSPGTAISLAVMPFENLSPDPNQGYFADGIGEEITTALAKIPDLRVVGRESAQQFKGKNENFTNIGRALHATHLLEGSIRKAGEQLRITTQLVRADTGVTLWANAYDRQETDIFAIQEDIARSIATSLHMTLGLKPGENLVKQRTGSAALHDQYLQARNLVRADKLDDAIKLLDDFVGREPAYAPAWAELAVAHYEKLVSNLDLVAGDVATATPSMRDHIAKGNAAAEQALRLDPGNAQALCIAARSRRDQSDVIVGMEMSQRALALDPDEPDCLEAYGLDLAQYGFPDMGLAVMNHLVAVEPLLPVFRDAMARVLLVSGQTDAAVAIWKGSPAPNARFVLALGLASQGRLQEAAEMMENRQVPKQFTKHVALTAHLLRNAPAPAPLDAPELGDFDLFYAFAGAPERVMGTFENHLRVGYTGGPETGWVWTPSFRAVRQTARFKAYIRNSGILAYWRAEGWPSRCHLTTDDFECS